VIGLTSAANTDFVKSLGCYDEVVTYNDVTSLPADQPVALVDMAGNSELRAKTASAFRRPNENIPGGSGSHTAARRRTNRIAGRQPLGSSRPTRFANGPRNGDRAASTPGSARRGRVLLRCWTDGSRSAKAAAKRR